MTGHAKKSKLSAFKIWLREKLAPSLPEDQKSALVRKIKDLDPPYGPSLPANSLGAEEVMKIFNIKDDLNNNHWYLPKEQFSSPQNEACMRGRLNAILISCIASERRRVDQASHQPSPTTTGYSGDKRPTTPITPEPVQLQFETALIYPVQYKNQNRTFTGLADYTLWYESAEDMGANLVVVEAKKKNAARTRESQCLSYMAVVHNTRKAAGKNSSVFGISTDGWEFYFLRIDNDSRYSVLYLDWKWGDPKRIVSIIRFIVRSAIESTPTATLTRPLPSLESPEPYIHFHRRRSELLDYETDSNASSMGLEGLEYTGV
ncbi:hypothetical protein F5884DRAFT_852854 [Xylogone sp. PMI_703]|nr:hypothetical protein F5884DRAFT_852854 [Xylogone sp. PMI_703]